jgi:hypothetical protein
VANDDSANVSEDSNGAAVAVLANDTDPESQTLTVTGVDTTGTAGTVTNNGTDVTYNPNGAFEGLTTGQTAPDSFTYTVSDGHGGTDTATVNVTIAGANDAPDAVDDGASTDEGSGTTVDVVANDSDAEGPFGLTAVDATGTVGTLTDNGDGTISYNPNGAFEGLSTGDFDTDTFTYTITDAGGLTDTATVTITVNGLNDPPVANDDNPHVDEDSTGDTVDVLHNDTDVEGQALTVTGVDTTGTTGSVTNNGTDITYDPNGQFEGLTTGQTAADSFTYTISDGHGGTETATVNVTIDGSNDAPRAIDDIASTDENSGTTVNVLANDSDAEGAISVASVDTTGTAGTVTDNGDGTVTYNPNGAFEGLSTGDFDTDTFTYTIKDADTVADTATVTITVNGLNDPPVAKDDNAGVGEDSTGDTLAVLGNDTDAEGQALTITGVDTTGTTGTVTNNGTDVTYDPNGQFEALGAGEMDVDTFTYTISDGHGGTDTATVNVTIVGANDAPDAVDDAYQTFTGQALNVPAPGLLANDTDPEGDALTIPIAGPAAHGVAEPNPDGSFTYTPDNTGYNGPDSFTYTVTDGNDGYDTATVNITIVAPNATPTADNVPDTAATGNEDGGAILITLTGHDADDDDLVFTAGSATNGVVGPPSVPDCSALNVCTASVTYIPNANYFGADSFTYSVNDGTVDSAPATVSVAVNAVNDVPSFAIPASPNQTVAEDAGPQMVSAFATAISKGPANESGQTLTFHSSNNNNGLFSAQPAIDTTSGDLTYTPAPNANGVATVTVSLSDDGGTANGGVDTSANKQFTITVTPVNDAPVGTPDAATTNEDTFVNLSVLGNDTDVDGDSLSIAFISTAGTVGTVTNNGNGTIKYNPAGHYNSLQVGNPNATDTFTYIAGDGHGANTGPVTVTMTITPVNDAPLANAETQPVVGNTLLSVSTAGSGPHTTASGLLTDGTVDPDDTSFTVTSGTSSTSLGTVAVNPNGSYTFLPAPGFTGSDTFTFTVHDAHGGTGDGTATMSVSNMVWYVDNSLGAAGDGRSTAPFNTIAPLNTGGSADSKDVTGDNIFLYQGTGAYTGGLTLEGSQKLWGQPHGLVVAGQTLAVAGGSNPTLDGGVVLGSGSDVENMVLGATSASGFALSGTSVGAATVGTDSAGGTVSINNSGGGGLVLNTGTPAVTLSKMVAGGTNGLVLTSLSSGTVRVNDTTSSISGTSATALGVSGGAGNLTYKGTVTSGAGVRSVSVANHTGGTIDLQGPITDGGTGILLTSNTGTLMNLPGTLTLNTITNPAFTATGGGTIAANNANNTAVTSTGTAVNIANTTISGSGVVFKSVASNGAANGIVLNTTGAGPFTVTGNGTADSGGIIQNSTGVGISLTSVNGVLLSRMKVTTGGDDGIRGTTVAGFTFSNGTVSSNGNAANENGMDFANLTGSANITSSTLTANYESNLNVVNDTGATTLNLSNDTLTSSAHNSGAIIETTGTGGGASNTTVNVTGTTAISSNFADGLQCSGTATAGGPGSILTCNVTGATFDANNIALNVDQSENADVVFDIESNVLKNSHSHALNLFTNATLVNGASMIGKVVNNNIGVAGVFDSGSAIGDGIRVVGQGRSDTAIRMQGNTIREVPNGYGFEIFGRAGDGGADYTVVSNTVVLPTGTNQSVGCGAGVMCPLDDFHIEANGGNNVCAKVSGNAGYIPTAIGGLDAYRLKKGTLANPAGVVSATTFRLEGTNANAQTEITATNVGAPVNADATIAMVAAGTCTTVP